MHQSKEKQNLPYREKLNEVSKLRYLEKLKIINGHDPYEHKEWPDDLNELPHVTFPDVFSLFVVSVRSHLNNFEIINLSRPTCNLLMDG